MKAFYSDMVMKNYSDIEETAQSIYELSHLLISESYRGRLNEKRYRMMKIIMSLFSEL